MSIYLLFSNKTSSSKGKEKQCKVSRALYVPLKCPAQSYLVAAAKEKEERVGKGTEGRANSEMVTFDKEHHSFLSDPMEQMLASSLSSLFQR